MWLWLLIIRRVPVAEKSLIAKEAKGLAQGHIDIGKARSWTWPPGPLPPAQENQSVISHINQAEYYWKQNVWI